MRLNDVDLLRLLPRFMRSDPMAVALCAALRPGMDRMADSIARMQLRDYDNLPSDVLDELAWQMNVAWYDPEADLPTKRAIIASAMEVYRTIGTPWAVEQVAIDYFGDASVQEWPEYGGEPYHFRVHTTSIVEGTRNAAKFRQVIEQMKNLRSVLDTILVETTLPAATHHVSAAMQHARVIRMDMETPDIKEESYGISH